MKWNILILFFLSLFISGCGAQLFAEKTEVEFYNPKTGNLIGRAFSNKGYDGFHCKAKLNSDGTGEIEWTANKVNSDTVAQSVADSNKILSNSLAQAVGAAIGIGVPIK